MRVLGGLVFCVLSGAALAQPAAPPPDPLIGAVGLGYLSTKGNTDSTNANAKFDATWDLDGPWKHIWAALAISARTDEVTTAESYTAGYKAQRDFSETNYLFAAADWRQDRFSGYDQQIAETVGYGRRLIDNERQVLSLEAGAGAKQSELVDGTSLDNAIVRGGLDYLLHIGENSEFSQKLLVEQSDDNRYTESTSALKAQIVGNIALVLSFVVKSNTDVPVGIENTDRFTSISLEYAF